MMRNLLVIYLIEFEDAWIQITTFPLLFIQAKIRGDCLTIALEPEAASIYCKHLPITQIQSVGKKDFGIFHPGSRYLVLDAGGLFEYTCSRMA
jgi:hypothetical protein